VGGAGEGELFAGDGLGLRAWHGWAFRFEVYHEGEMEPETGPGKLWEIIELASS